MSAIPESAKQAFRAQKAEIDAKEKRILLSAIEILERELMATEIRLQGMYLALGHIVAARDRQNVALSSKIKTLTTP
jgi:hypothetical protein